MGFGRKLIMEIPKQLKDEIWEYCRLNDITDINGFIVKSLQQGFNIDKYGTTPFEPQTVEKEIEVIKEVEKVVEVPVEVIKEIPVEKVVEKEIIKEIVVEKEVPVEKIIEKEVVKEVYITDDDAVNDLQKELDETKNTLKSITEDLNNEKTKVKEKDVKLETDNRKITDLSNQILQLKEEIIELKGKTTNLETKYKEEKKKVEELENSDQGLIKKLNQKIENLEIELELEKNRHYEPPKREKPIEEKPKRSSFGNIINWVSKSERDEDDLYGE